MNRASAPKESIPSLRLLWSESNSVIDATMQNMPIQTPASERAVLARSLPRLSAAIATLSPATRARMPKNSFNPLIINPFYNPAFFLSSLIRSNASSGDIRLMSAFLS